LQSLLLFVTRSLCFCLMTNNSSSDRSHISIAERNWTLSTVYSRLNAKESFMEAFSREQDDKYFEYEY